MTAPLIAWNEPIEQLASFIGTFLVAGAIGFRLTAARDGGAASDEGSFFDVARRRAASFGTAGAAIGLAFALAALPGDAAKAHESVAHLLASSGIELVSLACSAVVLLALASAIAGAGTGWTVAAVALLVETLAPLAGGRWTTVVNPIHRLAAGLWLGSLFMMVTVGLSPLLTGARLRAHRGSIAAAMVTRFSPMALSMGGVVVLFGLITAWRHLPTIASLWETPYGETLIIKLVFVALVFGLGAFNWRRQKPLLGHGASAISIQRSARAELSIAAVVLVITSILVSLPTPKRAAPTSTATQVAPTQQRAP